jgi:methylated-DNA-[protein]-cysteine S-methyltransferase
MSERTAPTGLAAGTFMSPVGDLRVACSAAGLARVDFGRPRGPLPLPATPPDAARDLLAEALRQLEEYFAGQRRHFDLPVDWTGVNDTQQRVLSALIEAARYGSTVTYGELAKRAGLPDGRDFPPARVVGQVMGSNRCPVIVPCHRVVAGNGLGGYSGGTGIEIKRWLLIFEGALPPTLDWDPAGPALA